MYAPPFDLSLDAFLKGEGNEAADLDLIEEFDNSFNELIINRADNFEPERDNWTSTFCTPHTKNFAPVDNTVIMTWPRTNVLEGCYHYRKTYNGVILLGNRGSLEGFYVDSVVSTSEECRGLGLGTELIIVASLLHGRNPALAMNKPQYTPMGIRAHKRAWETYRRFPNRIALNVKKLT